MKIRIKEFRENANLTQKQLAEKLHIKQSTLSGYENNFRQPDFETIEKITDIFSTSIDLLFGKTKKDMYVISKENYRALLKARDAINDIEKINKNT